MSAVLCLVGLEQPEPLLQRHATRALGGRKAVFAASNGVVLALGAGQAHLGVLAVLVVAALGEGARAASRCPVVLGGTNATASRRLLASEGVLSLGVTDLACLLEDAHLGDLVELPELAFGVVAAGSGACVNASLLEVVAVDRLQGSEFVVLLEASGGVSSAKAGAFDSLLVGLAQGFAVVSARELVADEGELLQVLDMEGEAVVLAPGSLAFFLGVAFVALFHAVGRYAAVVA